MYENFELLKEFLELSELIRPRLSIEIGAYDAQYSVMFKSRFPEVITVAYEANPFIFQNFEANLSTSIIYKNIAISNRKKKVKFQFQNDLPMDAGNNTIKKRLEKKRYSYLKISANSLNNLHNGEEGPIILWIDAEGANKDILKGANKILLNVEALLIETETKPYWRNQWLHDDVVNFLMNYNLILIKTLPEGPHQFNSIFVKKSFLT